MDRLIDLIRRWFAQQAAPIPVRVRPVAPGKGKTP